MGPDRKMDAQQQQQLLEALQNAQATNERMQRMYEERVVAMEREMNRRVDDMNRSYTEQLERFKTAQAATQPLVDTKVFNKVEKFGGDRAKWKDWAFVTKGFFCSANVLM